ncbi:hypothetical protein [Calothrix sp. PCC 7507]|uniref:hypothetical protein n=1 Tax=Calothrix sp. PCC 7507 TaxID=99598 RepID=UPI0019174DE8|nr:hypothetical protein [Calothrix sp. PCC 7507]
MFGGQTPFTGKWIGAGEIPENNELIRQGLWLYTPSSPFRLVEITIPLEIVHPEVQRCFLKCFNDGYKNPNLRPTAGDWVKALRLAVNKLTICGKVNSHYYSRTYGKCYWCDRSIKLGVDIFPGFARPKKAAVLESISQPKAFAVDKIIEIASPKQQSALSELTTTDKIIEDIIENIAKLVIIGIGLFSFLVGGWSIMLGWFAWFYFVWLCFCLIRRL